MLEVLAQSDGGQAALIFLDIPEASTTEDKKKHFRREDLH